jgi:hypothetical protein
MKRLVRQLFLHPSSLHPHHVGRVASAACPDRGRKVQSSAARAQPPGTQL